MFKGLLDNGQVYGVNPSVGHIPNLACGTAQMRPHSKIMNTKLFFCAHF